MVSILFILMSDELRAFKNALVNALNYHEKIVRFRLSTDVSPAKFITLFMQEHSQVSRYFSFGYAGSKGPIVTTRLFNVEYSGECY